MTQTREEVEKTQNLVDYLFSNSLTSTLLSTFIIAIVGVLIAKLRDLKKKLDLIEIVSKSMVELKKESSRREKEFEDKFIKSNENVKEQIGNLCSKIDKNKEDLENKIDHKTDRLEEKIDRVREEATDTLINYLSGRDNNNNRDKERR